MKYNVNLSLVAIPFPDAEWLKIPADQLQIVIGELQARAARIQADTGANWTGLSVDVTANAFGDALMQAMVPLVGPVSAALRASVVVEPPPPVSWVVVGPYHVIIDLLVRASSPSTSFYSETFVYTFKNRAQPPTLSLTIGIGIRCEINQSP
ncbi:MAG: hypothetical protein AABZ53_08720 [Planctomycetota bacterium]